MNINGRQYEIDEKVGILNKKNVIKAHGTLIRKAPSPIVGRQMVKVLLTEVFDREFWQEEVNNTCWYYENEIVPLLTQLDQTICKCNLWAGCTCGVFQKEMTQK